MEESLSLAQKIRERFALKEVDIRTYSPLALAYIGDAVYELVIRTYVVEEGNRQVNRMHKESTTYVKAGAQARLIERLESRLTEEELSVYKRGRNAKSYTSAKNATIQDYRMATGFEALIGYLYLTDQWERILELLQEGMIIL